MAVLKALVVLLIVSVAVASDVSADVERPPRKGKKLVSPRVLPSRPLMSKKHVIIVPKGDPRARAPSSVPSVIPTAPVVAPSSPVLKAGASSTTAACAAKSGSCVAKTACGTGVLVSGLCPGATYCCTPKAAATPATPATPAPAVDSNSCPVYGALATTPKAGNGGVTYQTVPIAAAHMVDTSKIGMSDELADNTLRQQPTACAFARMAEAAAKDGIALKIASGFRTLKRQQYFWNCYQTKKCNGGNLAAKPGSSNHGQGIAVDLNTDCGGQTGSRAPSLCKSSKVYVWLLANARTYGFIRAVQKEPWHWEYHAGTAMPSWAQF